VIIEIRRCGFRNKGAQLMLLAIVEQLRRTWPEATLVMVPSAPGGDAPFTEVTGLGLGLKASLLLRGVEFGDLAGCVPGRLRRRYGLFVDREVDVVLDAAGFAYSDQWGIGLSLELARATRRWRRRGTRVVLMPQAFGPFADRGSQDAIRRAVDDCDLVMPRDATSYRYLTSVTGEREGIVQYPDFTNLLDGVIPPWFDASTHEVAVVPNYRMVDKTNDATSAAYLPFMNRCVQRLAERGARPFLLVHEGADDERLARSISAASGGVPVVAEPDPLMIKGILGSSRAVIASRFHALVSALSQGVPALGTGWSHKYEELFEDYGFPEGVVSIIDATDRIDAMIDSLLDEDSHAKIAARLNEESVRLKTRSEAMWSRVHSVIESGRAR
jgi:colanic acid/amylovoran biosynthesis protein